MSLAAVPVFLWARSLVPARSALLAAALAVAVPGLAYSGLVMTEVLFYPLLVLAAWAAAEALARRTWQAQLLAVAAFLAVAGTRLQAIVLLPAYATAVGLDAGMARSWAGLRKLWPAAAGLRRAGARLARLAARVRAAPRSAATRWSPTRSYSVGGAAKYVVYHLADLLILVRRVAGAAAVAAAARPGAAPRRARPARARVPRDRVVARGLVRARGRDLRLPVLRPARRAEPDGARAGAVRRPRALARARRAPRLRRSPAVGARRCCSCSRSSACHVLHHARRDDDDPALQARRSGRRAGRCGSSTWSPPSLLVAAFAFAACGGCCGRCRSCSSPAGSSPRSSPAASSSTQAQAQQRTFLGDDPCVGRPRRAGQAVPSTSTTASRPGRASGRPLLERPHRPCLRPRRRRCRAPCRRRRRRSTATGACTSPAARRPSSRSHRRGSSSTASARVQIAQQGLTQAGLVLWNLADVPRACSRRRAGSR